MSEILTDDLRAQLAAWWQAVDQYNQDIYEQIFFEFPEVLSRVLSGGAWVYNEQGVKLGDLLGGDAAASLPQIDLVDGLIEVSPFHAQPGEEVSISWTDMNYGGGKIDAYVDSIEIYFGSDVVHSDQIDCAGLEPQASQQQAYTWTASDQAGEYIVVVHSNADGTDPGAGVPTALGYRGGGSGSLTIGATDEMADNQNVMAWGQAVGTLQAAGVGAYAEVSGHLNDAINWLATIDILSSDEQQVLASLGEKLARADEGYAPSPEELAPVQAQLSGASMQSMPTDEESRGPLFLALRELDQLTWAVR